MKTLTRIVSVVTLVLGVVSLAVGGMNIGFFYGSFAGTDFGDAVAAVLSGVVIILLMVGGLMDLICGLLGLRAAKRPGGSTAAVVFGVLAVIPGAAALIIDFNVQRALGLAIPALYLICVIAMKAAKAPETQEE